MAKVPQPLADIQLETFADDTTVQKSRPKHEPICQEINLYLFILYNWFKERNSIYFSLKIIINGEKVPTVKQPKILGVTFDNLFH